MKPKIDYSLYLVTDRKIVSTTTLEQAVRQAIQGGCTLVQLREKEATSHEFYHIAQNIKAITDRYHVPLIINDRVDIALAVDAAGVHIGQHDLPAQIARHLIGNHKILGVSASNLSEAQKAQKEGADYLGIGAMFATSTKNDAKQVSLQTLQQIRSSIRLPIVVIGGINKTTIPIFSGLGINGVAVVSSIIAEKDIPLAAAQLKQLLQNVLA